MVEIIKTMVFIPINFNSILLYWLEQREKSEVRQNGFPLKISSFWPSRPLKRLFCGMRAEGVVSRVQTFASWVAMKSPRWGKMFFHWKSVLFGLLDLWKGFVVAQEVRGWCHECQLLHHEGRRVSSKSPEWCKSWHEWHHPLTSRATTKPFQRSRRPKRTDFQWKNIFPHLGLFIATSDANVGMSDTTPSSRVPQKGLFKGWEGQKRTDFQRKTILPQPRTFHVALTNIVGCFFILVKGFCHTFYFYLIG